MEENTSEGGRVKGGRGCEICIKIPAVVSSVVFLSPVSSFSLDIWPSEGPAIVWRFLHLPLTPWAQPRGMAQ